MASKSNMGHISLRAATLIDQLKMKEFTKDEFDDYDEARVSSIMQGDSGEHRKQVLESLRARIYVRQLKQKQAKIDMANCPIKAKKRQIVKQVT